MAKENNKNTGSEIEDLVATLASRQNAPGKQKARALSGQERAAVLMLALGEQYGGKVWSLLHDDELRMLSITMSTIGTVQAEEVENLMLMVAKGSVLAHFTLSGFLLGYRQGYELYGLILGAAFGIITTFSDRILRKVDFGTLVGGLIGLASGLLFATLFLVPLNPLLQGLGRDLVDVCR